MARIRVEAGFHDFYSVLSKDDGEGRSRTFDTMKDIFMLAFAFGAAAGHRTELIGAREIFDDGLIRDDDRVLIKAVILADDATALPSLADPETLMLVAQEYANTGIRILKQKYLSATPAESFAAAVLDAVPAKK